ncbi:high-affinity Zn(2+) transporter zrt1 [Rhizophlyctis rosea]|nr:high-affinity Zn(2+) transporter zrt1 [Rhizophlyctis rosea]
MAAADAAGAETLDACAANFDGEYNKPLHIGAIFIILVFSLTGTMLPIISHRLSSAKKNQLPFHLIKLFGAGVILCTSFVHMFTPATEILTSECLPQVFHDYHAWAGAIALMGVLFTHLFQVLAASFVRDRLAKSGSETVVTSKDAVHVHDDGETGDHAGHNHGLAIEQAEKRIATYALEFGVAIHSVIIGVTLGATRGDDFIPLLIALVFHQFFEGIALASVVIDATYARRGQAIAMVLFYSLTTPLGIAIGVGINESFNANATHALISTGVLEALSAGILVYDALVNIICPHFNGRNYMTSSKFGRILQFFFLWLGAAAMALIGRWA